MRTEILEKITQNKNIFKVSLINMGINDNELLEIIETIKHSKPTVSVFDFDNNNITDEGAKILSEQLPDFNNIKEISLQFNNIGKEGAIELFSLKKIFSELDILFHGNKIISVSEMDEIERTALFEYSKP